ncbi:MAG: polysaccharide biosynthesis/export family protein [Sphingomonadaceae bacterium]
MSFIVLALGLTGCVSGPKPPPNPAVAVLEGERVLPAPDDVAEGMRGNSKVGPLDVLSFDVFGINSLSREKVQVGPSGQISLPLIGVVDVSGTTISEVEDMATQRLRSAGVRNPQVSVNFVDIKSQYVAVEGQVNKAGLYDVRKDMTLLRALASAEGLTEDAKTGNVMIFRTVGGSKMAGLYNVEAIRLGHYDDPPVFAGDVVVVNQDRAAVLFRNALGILPALTYVIVAIIN